VSITRGGTVSGTVGFIVHPSLRVILVWIGPNLAVTMYILYTNSDGGASRDEYLIGTEISVMGTNAIDDGSRRVQAQCLVDDLFQILQLREVSQCRVTVAKDGANFTA
jgi:hypothetical protein